MAIMMEPPGSAHQGTCNILERNARYLHMDDVDRKILAQLMDDGRISLAELGERVGLSPSAAGRRLARLEREGAIAGYAAIVDPAALGWDTEAFIELTCEGSRLLGDIRTALLPLPEVLDAWTVSGEADAIVHVRARDMQHLEQVIERLHANAIVARTKTSIVLSPLLQRGPRTAR